MNFIEAAITLLEERREPMHVEELCRLALERDLLSKPGAAPLRSLKGRLTTEARKGAAARVVKVDADVWALREGAEEETVAPGEEPVPPVPLTAEEEELARLYADEAEETTPISELTEYRDEHTADEDRPMLPEIRSERRRRGGKERRPRKRDKEGDKEREKERDRGRSRRGRERGRGRERIEAEEEVGVERLGLAERAYRALAAIKNGQPVRARQLAQMMKKRDLLADDPDRTSDLLRAALLADENERLGRGMRPRIVHRGRDLFALATAGLESDVLAAEEAVEEAAAGLERSTRKVLAERLGELKQPSLERVVQLYLERVGWGELGWIKRVGGASYATATPPDLDTPSLVGTRVGKKPIDRRGIGELRAGLEAKGLPRGLLVTPQPLSDEAQSELEREGKPVELLCGDDFLRALVAEGIGVVRRAAPLMFLDVDFLDGIA